MAPAGPGFLTTFAEVPPVPPVPDDLETLGAVARASSVVNVWQELSLTTYLAVASGSAATAPSSAAGTTAVPAGRSPIAILSSR